jgi:hypothetical protein
MRRLDIFSARLARNLTPAVAFALAFAAVPQSAFADFVVEIDRPGGGVDYRIEDNGPLDVNSANGIIGVAIDENSEEFVMTATSKPNTGLDTAPYITLNVNLAAFSGQWNIRVTDTGFDVGASQGHGVLRGGVVGSGGIEFTCKGDQGNDEFGESFSIGTGTMPAGSISELIELNGSTDAVGSATLVVKVLEGSGENKDATISFVAGFEIDPSVSGGGENPPPELPEEAPVSFPPNGTIGTEVVISGAGFDTKKNKVYVEFENEKGKTQTKNLKVTSWADNLIRANWTADVDPGRFDLFVQAKGGEPRGAGTFSVLPPVPQGLANDTGWVGQQRDATGSFFGDKGNQPKIDFEYTNSKGKLVRANAKILKDEAQFDPHSNFSALPFVLPELNDKDLPATGVLRITTKIGEAVINDAFTITAPPPPAVTDYTPNDGTIGSQITIDGVGFGTKKGKAFVEVQNNKGKMQKKTLKVLSWADGAIVAEWTQVVAPGTYELLIEAKEFGPVSVGEFEVRAPASVLLWVSTAHKGDTIDATAFFLGTNKAKPKLTFEYTNSKGKLVSANVKISENALDVMTGFNSLDIVVPKLNNKDLPVTGTVTFSNKIGEAPEKVELTIEL